MDPQWQARHMAMVGMRIAVAAYGPPRNDLGYF